MRSLLILSSLTLLTACAPFYNNSSRNVMCNHLNSEMIFRGDPSKTRSYNLQTSDQPLIQRTYDKHCEH